MGTGRCNFQSQSFHSDGHFFEARKTLRSGFCIRIFPDSFCPTFPHPGLAVCYQGLHPIIIASVPTSPASNWGEVSPTTNERDLFSRCPLLCAQKLKGRRLLKGKADTVEVGRSAVGKNFQRMNAINRYNCLLRYYKKRQ